MMLDSLKKSGWPNVPGHHVYNKSTTVHEISCFLRNHVVIISLSVLMGILGSASYIMTSDSVFTARTQILIEPKIPQLLQQQAMEVQLSLDTSQVETQLEVLRSEKIAMMVIDALELAAQPHFMQFGTATLGERVRRLGAALVEALDLDEGMAAHAQILLGKDRAGHPDWFGIASAGSEFEVSRRAVEAFRQGLRVERAGVSYVINIYFSSLDPKLAANIANATADSFVREQLETRSASASEGLQWLESRIDEVREQMNLATQRAQEFRARHDYRISSLMDEGRSEEDTAGPTLEELEVAAETYRKIYESLLAALANSVNQQPYLIADARVVTTAAPPLGPSHPRRALILAFGLTVGLMSGVGLALMRHALDRTARSPDQLRGELGLECIGELPVVKFHRGGFGRFDEVVKDPGSVFGRNLQNTLAAIGAIESSRGRRLIGVTSVSPGDGKSTVASNLAALCGLSGIRALLIDADAANSTITENLVDGPIKTRSDPKANIKAVSAIAQMFDIVPNTASLNHKLSTPQRMGTFLDGLGYEIVIVDLPAFTTGSAGLAIHPLLDGVVIVAQWGKTPLDLLDDLSRLILSSKTPVLGVVLTKVKSLHHHQYRGRIFQAAR